MARNRDQHGSVTLVAIACIAIVNRTRDHEEMEGRVARTAEKRSLVVAVDAEGLPRDFLRVATRDQRPQGTRAGPRFGRNARGEARRDQVARAREVRLLALAYGACRDLRGNAAPGEDRRDVAASPPSPRRLAEDGIGDHGVVERANLAEARDRAVDGGTTEPSRGQPGDQLEGGEPAPSERPSRLGERARRLIGSRLRSSGAGRPSATLFSHAAAVRDTAPPGPGR